MEVNRRKRKYTEKSECEENGKKESLSYQESFIQAPGTKSFSSFWAFTDSRFPAFYGNPMRMSSHPFLIHDAIFIVSASKKKFAWRRLHM